MPTPILMPQLSPTMTEGRLAKWTKQAGEAVQAGDVIAEVETDKATMEVEATEDGIIHTILEEPGQNIPVNHPIAVLKEEGEEVPDDYTPPKPEGKPEAKAETSKEEEASASTSLVQEIAPSPSASPQPAMAALPLVNANIATTAPAPKAPKAPMPQASHDGGRAIASPLARRIARQKGVNLGNVVGTGPNGRVTASDLAAMPNFGGSAETIKRATDSAVTNSPMRKAIASRLQASKQQVPHFYLEASVEMDAAMELRQQINAKANGAYKITVNDLILKACANALASLPQANAAWNGDSIVYFGNVDVSVAVALPDGLITPIVFNANQKNLPQISAEVKALAASAKAGELKPEQYEGGGFSLSNLGMFGTERFRAIINPPQAAIVAVGAAKPEVVADAQGNAYVANIMHVNLSCDHRVIDGALGAQLLNAIQENLENPVGLVL